MIEFEYILFKSLLNNGAFFKKAMPILKKKYFVDYGNQRLFTLIQEHYEKYREIPAFAAVVASVREVPNSEVRGQIINSLKEISSVEEIKNQEFMIDKTLSWVKDAIYMESLQIGSDGLMNNDEDMKLKARQLMEEMVKVSIDSDLGLDFDDIDTMIDYYSERNIGIKTQHKEFNKRLGPGFLPKTLSIILAAASVGKSLLMTDLISGMIKDSKNILLVSLEMADKEIMKRVHANAMNLPVNALLDLSKTEGELKDLGRDYVSKEMILSAYNKIKMSGTCGKLFVKDYPAGSFTPLMLEQLVESYKLEKGIVFDAVFVDYLGIMKSDLISPSAGLYSYIKSVAEELRAVAKKLSLPIISASQLNRGATNKTEDVDNSNISDSLGTAMTADFMLFLLQNEEMKEKCEIVCKVTKNRFNGRTDTWLMNVDYEYMRFNDMIVKEEGVEVEISDASQSVINKSTVFDDFGIVTSEKKEKADEFANSEVKKIVSDDLDKLSKKENDPFKADSIDEIFSELGIN